MRDVAAVARVSAKTVSRVFNADPHVSLATRTRVEAALRQLNYVPSSLAINFRAGRAPVIGVAIPDLVDPFFAALADAIGALAMASRMSIVVTSLGQDPAYERDKEIVEALLRQSISGLIIAPSATDHAYLQTWSTRLPIVFVDRPPVRVAADSFTEDDHGGAYEATQHLILHGHRRIAFIGDTLLLPTTKNRLAGYRAAVEDHGAAIDPDYIELGVWYRDDAVKAVGKIDSLAHPPTAIFCSNGRCSMVVIPALRGKEYAFVSFGDFPMGDMLVPALTVIDQDPAALGTLAAQRVLDRLNHPQRRYRRRTVLPVPLLERESCFPAAGAAESPAPAYADRPIIPRNPEKAHPLQ
jgi:LacI family transcriptional regulator